MKYFKVTRVEALVAVLAIGLLAFGSVARAQTTTSTSGANSNAASGSQSDSVAISGGGGGGTGGVGASNFTVNPTVPINSTGASLSKALPSMIAPALSTTLTETCLGSASGALAVSGFGLTGGKTYVDSDCVARLNAREMRAIGQLDVAMEILCSRPTVYTAMARVAQRTRTLSKCSGQNPLAKGYDPMALSSELMASGGYDIEDVIYVSGMAVSITEDEGDYSDSEDPEVTDLYTVTEGDESYW